ncbi:4'-phosphopantetheinyl transferase superfamily protein [Ekhidna sp. MALMAid0563]|uniref:4'-phosphopantetheinyl transferase family protein n=1 Tax=Ekhidna sp. MALMAid0563 TaxID=3143937 RepID=UPI0032DF4993
MLGIDIVDIKDPSFKERNSRTHDLISNPDDVSIEHPHIFWILWSAKEAAFKCKREPLNFAPKKIPIKLSEADGNISFQSGDIKGEIKITDEYILAICGDLDNISFKTFEKSDDDWSEGIRFMVIEFFRDQGLDYHIGSDELNLPIIEPSKKEISISHHGRYGAVAFPINLL